MEIGFTQAVSLFEGLPPELRAPSLHPFYVRNDTQRHPGASPLFFAHHSGGEVFYHALVSRPVPDTDLIDLQSPYGYGGPLATSSCPEFLLEANGLLEDLARDRKAIAEFVRFHPVLENWRFYTGQTADNRRTVAIDLDSDDPLLSFRGRARTAVRKALATGLHIRPGKTDNDIKMFCSMYEQDMLRLDASREYFFGGPYLRGAVGWEAAELLHCESDEGPMATALFFFGGTIAEYHLSASTPKGREAGAINLLLHEAAKRAKAKGCGHLHLGGGSDGATDNPLLFFKAGFSDPKYLFKIGWKVLLPQAYEELRSKLEKQGRATGAKVLFYRD